MNITALKLFVSTVKYGGFKRVADQYGISIPAISNQLTRLENEIGEDLFRKRGQDFRLSEYGYAYYDYAQKMIRFHDDAIKETHDMKGQLDYDLMIAVMSTANIMPHIVNGFHKNYPEIVLNIEELQQNLDVSTAEQDVMIFSSTSVQSGDSIKYVHEDPVYIAVANDHPFVKKKNLKLDDFSSEKYIDRTNYTSLTPSIEQLFEKKGFTPKTILSCNDPSSISQMLCLEGGFSFMPKLTWLFMERKDITLLKVDDAEIKRYLHFSTRANGYCSKAALNFIDYAREVILMIEDFWGKMQTL